MTGYVLSSIGPAEGARWRSPLLRDCRTKMAAAAGRRAAPARAARGAWRCGLEIGGGPRGAPLRKPPPYHSPARGRPLWIETGPTRHPQGQMMHSGGRASSTETAL